MSKNLRFSTAFVIVFLFVSFWAAADGLKNTPVAVSPGSDTEVTAVWQSCPTFSWSAVDQAASYRIAVFEASDPKVPSYADMAAVSSPVVSKDIPGPALSWTLSADKSLKTGTMYAWYVQAVDASGNVLGQWSNGRIFKVEQEARFAGIADKLAAKLRNNGVNEETISNVMNDMKSEETDVAVQNTSAASTSPIKNIPGLTRILGYEGENDANTYYGYVAGIANTTGSGNSFFGYKAGDHNISGYSNTFVGASAGTSNATTICNTFVGANAGQNSFSSYNTFVGSFAGLDNRLGQSNTFIGYSTGNYNLSGNNNTFLGCRAGDSNSASNNNFLGYYAGFFNSSGSNNTFLGNWAGYTNMSGSSNTFLGNETGYKNQTGSYNTFIGRYAGNQTTAGQYNVFIGYQAGFNEIQSYKLYIDSSSTSTPLIYGDFNLNIVTVYGKLGVGVIPNYPLHMASGAYCSTGGTWTNASSRALKENIKELDANEALAAFEKLIPVKYNYKVDKNDKHVGFIAEDAPDLVATADKKGMSPMDVVAVLTKVLQEQQKVNQEQQKIIADLQERLAKIEKK